MLTILLTGNPTALSCEETLLPLDTFYADMPAAKSPREAMRAKVTRGERLDRLKELLAKPLSIRSSTSAGQALTVSISLVTAYAISRQTGFLRYSINRDFIALLGQMKAQQGLDSAF